MEYKISKIKLNGCVYVPDSLWSFALVGYEGSREVKEIILPHHVNYKEISSIAAGVFSGMTELEKVIIPFALKSFGNRCFAGCHRLKLVTTDLFEQTSIWEEPMSMLPSSVNEIGEEAFEGTAIQTVIVLNAEAVVGDRCFANSQLNEFKCHPSVRLGRNVFDELELVETTEVWKVYKKKEERK